MRKTASTLRALRHWRSELPDNPQDGPSKQGHQVLIFAPNFWPAVAAGGTARSLTNLVREAPPEAAVTVVTAADDLGDVSAFTGLTGHWLRFGGSRVYYFDTGSVGQTFSLFRLLRKTRWDSVVLNSYWSPVMSVLPALLTATRLMPTGQVVLMPRGGLEPGALHIKAQKKRLAAPIFRLLYQHAVDVFAVTSESEMLNVRGLFPHKETLLVSESPDALDFESTAPINDGLRIAFVGRIHPTKGLVEAIRALQLVKQRVHLSIAGPIADEHYWAECLDLLSQLPDNATYEFLGVVSRDGVATLLTNSDVMISLTLGENFGHTIAEALQVGCSVMTTNDTPWTSYLSAGNGYCVSDRTQYPDVAQQLDLLAQQDATTRVTARQQARRSFEAWQADQPPSVLEAISFRPARKRQRRGQTVNR